MAAAGSSTLLNQMKRKEKKEQREAWNRKRLLRRYTAKDLTYMAKKQLALEDPAYFKHYTRMTRKDFQKLLRYVGPLMRDVNLSIGEERVTVNTSLLITLRYLISASSFEDLSQEFLVDAKLISNFVPQTLKCISAGLQKNYLYVNKCPKAWKDLAAKFGMARHFPHTMGAIGAKHLAVMPGPEDNDALYMNYKGFHSILFLAIVGYDCRFIVVEVGSVGKINDEQLLGVSAIGEAIELNYLHFPKDEKLYYKGKRAIPYVFLSYDAFAQSNRVLVPYRDGECTEAKLIFNIHLARAYDVFNEAIAMLTHAFPIFKNTSNLKISEVEAITMAGCTLHNFIIMQNSSSTPPRTTSKTKELLDVYRCRDVWCPDDALEIRDEFRDFFTYY